MSKHHTKAITKTDDNTKEKKEDVRAAAREFWANQRIQQTEQPPPSQSRSMKI